MMLRGIFALLFSVYSICAMENPACDFSYTEYETDEALLNGIRNDTYGDSHKKFAMSSTLFYRKFYEVFKDIELPKKYKNPREMLPYVKKYREIVAWWDALCKEHNFLPAYRDLIGEDLERFPRVAQFLKIFENVRRGRDFRDIDLSSCGFENLDGLQQLIGDHEGGINLRGNPLTKCTKNDLLELQGLPREKYGKGYTDILLDQHFDVPDLGMFDPGAWNCQTSAQQFQGDVKFFYGGMFWRIALPILSHIALPGFIARSWVPFLNRSRAAWSEWVGDGIALGSAYGAARILDVLHETTVYKKLVVYAAVPILITRAFMHYKPCPKSLPVRYGVFEYCISKGYYLSEDWRRGPVLE